MSQEHEEIDEDELEKFQAELLKYKALITDLRGRLEAVENIVYQKVQKSLAKTVDSKRVIVAKSPIGSEPPTPGKLKIENILGDLDVSLADRLEIIDEDTVKPAVYFHDKDDWVTVNKLLKQYGFNWNSRGKNSAWSRK